MELIGVRGIKGVGGSIYISASTKIGLTWRRSTNVGGGDHQFGGRVVVE